MPWSISPSCPTIRSDRTIPPSRTRSTIRARSLWRSRQCSAGIRRFVYTSSCSVYGAGTGEFLDEAATVNPQTAYAQCKVLVERDLLPRWPAADFAPGLPAQRHRLRPLAAHALRHRDQRSVRARLDYQAHRDDQRWQSVAPGRARPGYLPGHLSQPRRRRRTRCAAGSSMSDRTPRTTGCASWRRSSPTSSRDARSRSAPPVGDNRSYRVNFDRIHRELPGFRCQFTARDGVRAAARAVRAHSAVSLRRTSFRAFTRLKQLQVPAGDAADRRRVLLALT